MALTPLACVLVTCVWVAPVSMAHGEAVVASSVVGEQDVIRMKVFAEPLTPIGSSTPDENAALMASLQRFQSGRGENPDVLRAFIDQHPQSAWRLSLLTHLGKHYRHLGYFSQAMQAFEEAWKLGAPLSGKGAQLADQACVELAELYGRLGRVEALTELLKGMQTRKLRGSLAERASFARESLESLRQTPERSYRCGPLSLASLAKHLGRPYDAFLHANGSPAGTSLSHNLQLARQHGLELVAVRRSGTQAMPPLPCVIHMRSGHFAALISESNGRYLLSDPTFGDDLWITQGALQDEWSGSALVLPARSNAMESLSEGEASAIMGKGGAPFGDQNANSDCNTTAGGKGCKESGCHGMPEHSFHSLLASLFVQDVPVGYAPPVGPSAFFRISYSQRDVIQPATFTYSNLGSKWRFNYQAYIQDDPTVAIDTAKVSMNVKLHGINGGFKTFTFNAAEGAKPPGKPGTGPSKRHEDGSFLIRTGLRTYERYLPDGSKEVYGQPDGAALYPRNILLTQVVDATGATLTLNYDNANRLKTMVDALGRKTVLEYAGDDLKIQKVTDPFGRSARFEYDEDGLLKRVTDVIGLATEFSYGPANGADYPADFMNAMSTPYGTTQFSMGEDSDARWVEALDPMGGRERLEFRKHPNPKAVDANLMPPGFISQYPGGTFYWNQRMMALYPRDYDRSQYTRWVKGSDGEGSVDIPHSLRSPEGGDTMDTWFTYAGQPDTSMRGRVSQPSKIIRHLGEGQFQEFQYEYNELGRPTKVIDPMGRTTLLTYDQNAQSPGYLMDLLEVKQQVGPQTERLASYTYNGKHQPLMVTDASGQVTSFTYYDNGQLKSITNPKKQATTLYYNSLKQLERVDGIGGRSTSFAYDEVGRIKAITDPEKQTVVIEAYDNLDRPLKVVYSDGTFEQMAYDRLDVKARRDRTGRWTQMKYNALRQLIEVEDALGRITRMDWCGCGTLDGLIDPMGRTTQWIRDLNSRVVAKLLPDRTKTSYSYDELGRLSSRVDAKNQITLYNYNVDNSLKNISYQNSRSPKPSKGVSYTYEKDYNRLSTMTDGVGTTKYTYHPITSPAKLGAGRLATETSPFAKSTISYAYDELGRVKARDINGVKSEVSYDALGRPETVTNALGGFKFGFEGNTSRLSSLGLPNGMTTAFSYYDATQQYRLKEISHKTGSAQDAPALAKFGYEYDAFKQIKTWTQQADAASPKKTFSFEYDAVGQLLDAKLLGPNGQMIKQYVYGYDEAGNRTSESVDGTSISGEYNDGNQLIKRKKAASNAARSAASAKAKADKR